MLHHSSTVIIGAGSCWLFLLLGWQQVQAIDVVWTGRPACGPKLGICTTLMKLTMLLIDSCDDVKLQQSLFVCNKDLATYFSRGKMCPAGLTVGMIQLSSRSRINRRLYLTVAKRLKGNIQICKHALRAAGDTVQPVYS
jgi:hypothetical protein